MNNHNYTAIVTGGTKGLGFGISQSLAADGWNLHLISRNLSNLNEARQKLLEKYPSLNISTQSGDMSLPDTISECKQILGSSLNNVRALILNHGGPPAGQILDFSDEQWLSAYELLIGSVVRWCRAFVPIFREHHYGKILILGSSSMREPIMGLALSNVMRAGLVSFIRTAAREWGQFGITINGLAPGSFLTERLSHLLKIRADKNHSDIKTETQLALQKIPLGRFGDPLELGALAAFLVSEQASYITGQTILCDGGATVGLP